MRSDSGVLARTLTFVLAGGEGKRLLPLTRNLSKPLAPFGGAFRIVDFALSNCLNSGIGNVHVLTQYERESMHAYLRKGWTGMRRNRSDFVIPCPAPSGKRYRGTADAVFQNLSLLDISRSDFVLILSADHIYGMNYRELLRSHVSHGADVTIAAVDSPISLSSQVGVLEVNSDGKVVGFEEKPPAPKRRPGRPDTITANMGIYVFNRSALMNAAEMAGAEGLTDFGHDLLPILLRYCHVHAYRYRDDAGRPRYWRDVGTLDSYHSATMDLLSTAPPLDPFDPEWPIRSGDVSEIGEERRHPNSIVPGSLDIRRALVHKSVLFDGVTLEPGAEVWDSILMPGVKVGRGAIIRRAIIDSNVKVEAGDQIGCDLSRDRKRFEVTGAGIVVVPQPCPEKRADAATGVEHSFRDVMLN